MEWLTNVIVPIVIPIITLIGTLAGVNVQMASVKKEQKKAEQAQIVRDEQRQSVQEDALRSILRSELLRIYFKHIEKNNKTLTQWESQNVHLLYSSYKDLGGNSFITDLVEKMNSWEIVRD